jgi:hypothetical protein
VKVNEEVSRKAKDLLDDPLVLEVLEILEDRAISDWKQSDPKDSEGRDHAWALVRAIEQFKTELGSIAANTRITAWNRRLRGKT